MSDKEKKEGFFGKLFGGKKSDCCSTVIEEIQEDENGTEKPERRAPVSGCCTPGAGPRGGMGGGCCG